MGPTALFRARPPCTGPPPKILNAGAGAGAGSGDLFLTSGSCRISYVAGQPAGRNTTKRKWRDAGHVRRFAGGSEKDSTLLSTRASWRRFSRSLVGLELMLCLPYFTR